MNKSNLKHCVFWPPFLLILVSIILNLWNPKAFEKVMNVSNSFVLNNLSWMFSTIAIFTFILCIITWFSPLGKIVIGGKDAKPMLNKKQWFSVTLCTTIAVGILFWSTAEPIIHLTNPPKVLNIEPQSYEAAIFSMSTMFVHWSFIPFAIYTVPALVFTISYYNLNKSFSVGSILSPIVGSKFEAKISVIVDCIALYSLVLGVGTSLGTGVLMLSGGLSNISNRLESSPKLWLILTIIIIVACIVSSVSGLMKGIRILSNFNVKLFGIILLFVLLFGPTVFILNLGLESFGSFIDTFFSKSMFTESLGIEGWPQSWTVFYWANYMSWAPITAIFLGRISKGYKVRDFLLTNFILPSIFCIVYISIFSGTIIWHQMCNGIDMASILTAKGYESLIYELFRQLPFSKVTIPLFIFIVFISFVTATDSMTNAMAAMTTYGISEFNQEAPIYIKIIWGLLISSLSFIMLRFAGIKGMKMLSTLGGVPSALIILGSCISLIALMKKCRN